MPYRKHGVGFKTPVSHKLSKSTQSSSTPNLNLPLQQQIARRKFKRLSKLAEGDNFIDENDHVGDIPFYKPDTFAKAVYKGTDTVERNLFQKMALRTSTLLKLMELSEGQDKTFKVVTSVLKILSFILIKYKSPNFPWIPEIVKRLKNVAKSTSLARKMLRLFQLLVFARMIIRILRNNDPYTAFKVLVLGRLIGLFLYFSGNMLDWSVRAGAWINPPYDFLAFSLRGVLFSQLFTWIIDGERIMRTWEMVRKHRKLHTSQKAALATQQRQLKMLNTEPGSTVNRFLANKLHTIDQPLEESVLKEHILTQSTPQQHSIHDVTDDDILGCFDAHTHVTGDNEEEEEEQKRKEGGGGE